MASGVSLAGPDDGPPVMLLHGGGSNRRMWLRLTDHLADRYRVIALDLPGHGDHRRERFGLDAAVASASAALDEHAGDEAAIVGTSLGGYVGLAMAARHATRVSALVLSGATAEYLGWGGFTTRLSAIVFRLAPRFRERKSAEAIRRIVAPELAEPMVESGLSMRGAADALWDLPGRDYHEMLEPYHGPLLILNGERDSENRRAEGRAKVAWPQARIEVVEDAGHACVVTQPDRFAIAVRRFLDQLDEEAPSARVQSGRLAR